MADLTTFVRELKKGNNHLAFQILNDQIDSITDEELRDLVEEQGERIYLGYFGQDLSVIPLVKILFESNYDLAIRSIKQKRAFLLPLRYNSWKFYLNKEAVSEFDFWAALEGEINKDISLQDSLIKAEDFETFLINITILSEYYRSPGFLIDRPEIPQIFSLILKRRLELASNPTSDSTEEDFYRKCIKVLSNWVKDHLTEAIWLKLFETFDSKENFEYLLQKYCSGQLRLTIKSNKRGLLEHTNRSEALAWKINDEKYRRALNVPQYLVELDFPEQLDKITSADLDPYRKEASIRIWLTMSEYLRTYLPLEFVNKGGIEIEVYNYFRKLNSMSQYFNDNWNHRFEKFESSGKKIPERIMHYIMTELNGGDDRYRFPIRMWSFESFVNNSSDYDDPNQVKAIAEYVCSTTDPVDIDLNISPYLRVGNNVFGISSFCSNKNYAKTLYKKLVQTKDVSSREINFASEQLEQDVGAWFERNDFEYKVNYKSRFEGKQIEIDLLAYKDDTLFVGEVKSSFPRDTIQTIEHFNEQALNKQKDQLKRDIRFVQENWGEIRKALNIGEQSREPRIFPFGLSNNFEGEEMPFLYRNIKCYKISLLELELLLKRSKFMLFNALELDHLKETNPHFFQSLMIHSEANAPIPVSGSELANAIETRWLWKGVIIFDVSLEVRIFQFGEFEVEHIH